MTDQPRESPPAADAPALPAPTPSDAGSDWARIVRDLQTPLPPDPVLKSHHPKAPDSIVKK